MSRDNIFYSSVFINQIVWLKSHGSLRQVNNSRL